MRWFDTLYHGFVAILAVGLTLGVIFGVIAVVLHGLLVTFFGFDLLQWISGLLQNFA